MRKILFGLIAFISSLIILACASVIAQQPAQAPIPAGAQTVTWMRVSQVAQDPDLRAVLLGNSAITRYLGLLNMDLAQIDLVTLFMPFDKAWLNGPRLAAIPQTLPRNGAFIITGNFAAKDKFQAFKAKGWKETSYSNKKILWWSTGASYYRDIQSGECIGLLPGGGLVIAGSEESIKSVLDVAGGKAPGLQPNSTFQQISQDFISDNARLASAFSLVTPEMRNMIKADTIAIRSTTGRAALSYIDHLDEAGLSIAKGGNGFLLKGYLGMDNESNALIVTSIVQIGGGLAPMLSPNNPYRNILEGISASRQGNIVLLESSLSHQQFLSLLRQGR